MAIKEPINITDKSEPSGRSVESIPFGPGASVPEPSSVYAEFNRNGNAKIGNGTQGRDAGILATVFPVTALGLESYEPYTMYQNLLSGDDPELALGAKPALGAESYMGPGYGTTHLTHANAPDLANVNTEALNIPNPYVPDISAGKANASDYAGDFKITYPGTRNSFPPGETDTGLDLNAGDGGLSPHRTVRRLGSWTKDTLTFGRWTDDQ
jgi:hypothetical protein